MTLFDLDPPPPPAKWHYGFRRRTTKKKKIYQWWANGWLANPRPDLAQPFELGVRAFHAE